ncbi:hypothetical protein MBLNU457_7508t1 [Dothideomycetes sp. NU457]
MISTAWEDLCIPYFMHEWTIPVSYTSDMGFLHFLPDLLSESTSDSCLFSALKAIAYASFAHQQRQPSLIARSRTSYGRAIRAVNFALRSPTGVIADGTLASVLMLQFYEHIDAQDYQRHSAHNNGLRLLLRLRGDAQFRTAQGHHLYRNVMGYLQAYDTSAVGLDAETLPLDFAGLSLSDAHPAVQYFQLISAKKALVQRVEELMANDLEALETRTKAQKLLQASARIDAYYAAWFAGLSECWPSRRVAAPRACRLVPASGRVYSFSVPSSPCIMASARVHRAGLLAEVGRVAMRLGVAEWTSCSADDDLGEIYGAEICSGAEHEDAAEKGTEKWSLHRCREVIRQQYEEILSTAAFTLGALDDGANVQATDNASSSSTSSKLPLRGRCVLAFYMASSLLHVYKDGNSTALQKADARRCLEYMGNELGMRRFLAEI